MADYDNPLMRRETGGMGSHGQPRDLDGYAAWLNAKAFTKAMGWHWFVGKRQNADGTITRFLDRNDRAA